MTTLGAAVADLLTGEAGPFRIALAKAMSDALSVPIAEIVDPAQCPSALLPWLAAHESVDLWFSDWPDAVKRSAIANAWSDAAAKGRRAGASAYLAYVSGSIVDAIAYPSPFVVGRTALGRPINHPPFLARYLVKVPTTEPTNCTVMGRTAIGRAAVRTPDPAPFDRALAALEIARAPEAQIRVSFQHHRPLTISDAPELDSGAFLGQWVAHNRL